VVKTSSPCTFPSIAFGSSGRKTILSDWLVGPASNLCVVKSDWITQQIVINVQRCHFVDYYTPYCQYLFCETAIFFANVFFLSQRI